MRVAIVYDTHTGITAGAAEKMAEVVRAAGHDCVVSNVSNGEAALSGAKAVVLGAWTQGWFIIRQHPSEPMMGFLKNATLTGKLVAVFATYKLAVGSTVRQLADQAESAGGKVTGMYKVKGPNVPDGFERWVASLESSAAL
ncbi:MAG: flavodoxin domain-containing protein [Chloroflexota bacterium]|jgi:flavodoxin